MNNTCVYLHINPVKNEIFYVGIGGDKRAISKKDRSSFWYGVVKRYGYIIDVVDSNLSWDAASKKERFYIKRIGRRDLGLGTLVNMTDGGDGLNNPSKETRAKIGVSSKKRFENAQYKNNFISKTKGRVESEEVRQRKSERMSGDKNSFYNKKHSPESKKKITEAKKGKPAHNKKYHTEEQWRDATKRWSKTKRDKDNPNRKIKDTPYKLHQTDEEKRLSKAAYNKEYSIKNKEKINANMRRWRKNRVKVADK